MRMVEKVARALHDEWFGVGNWSSLTDQQRMRWVSMAKAAIDAYERAKMDDVNQHAPEFIRDEKGRIVGTKVSA